MQIVIEIPDHYKNLLGFSITELNIISEAVRNGTPLPKGHGRLIDGDALKDRMKIGYKIVGNAPTIIEADAESEGKE